MFVNATRMKLDKMVKKSNFIVSLQVPQFFEYCFYLPCIVLPLPVVTAIAVVAVD